MGLQQGAACRDKLLLIDGLLPQLEAFRLAQPWWLSYGLFRRAAEGRATRMVRRPLLRDDPEIHARLAGISQGSGVRLRLLYLINALECLLASPRRCTVMPPLAACSAVAVRGSRSATGGPLIARNFDYLPLVQPTYTLRESRPTGRFRTLDFTMAPLAGAVDGLNERGVCITYDYGFAIDDAQGNGPPISASITTAAGTYGDRKRRGPADYVAAAAGWRAASCWPTPRETLPRSRFRPRGANCGVPRRAKTSFITPTPFTPRRCRECKSRPRRFSRPAPRRRCATSGRSIRRLARRPFRRTSGPALAAAFGWEELTAIMSDHGPPGSANGHGLCVHSDYWNTTACIQLEPQRRKFRIDYAYDLSGKVFRRSRFDGQNG